MTWKGWEKYVPPVRGAAPTTKGKRAKYRAEPTEVNGIRFASRKEAARYEALLLEQKAGTIRDLELQPQFPLHAIGPDGVKVCVGRYIADFAYSRDGQRVVEDCKGFRTPGYLWKLKHTQIEHAISILET